MTARRTILVLPFCLGLLASCAAPPPPPLAFPDLRFSGQPPLLLDAARIEVVDAAPPGQADSDFPVTSQKAAENWAQDRLRADGQSNVARFTVETATTAEQNLPIAGGIGGTLTDQVSQQYDVAIGASLEILDPRGAMLRTAHVASSRTRTVLQSATANDRAQARYDMVRDLMADFDRQMDAQIRGNFGLYLLSR